MEPWLNSLSEDWKSEQRSSSPAPSFSSSHQHGNTALSRSQSRIPHLAKNMRKDSSTGSFLRHRSTRGQARTNGEPVLRERSASSLNVPATADPQKFTSLPRRPSSVFSESQNSVQHHTIHEKPTLAETPEWKRRLANGEDIASDGFDLFSPSKLEGIFKQPIPSQLNSDNDVEQNDTDQKIRKPFSLPVSNSFPEQYSSFRPARGHVNLEVLEEVSEEEETQPHDMPALASDLARSGSLKGLVKQRVQSLERPHGSGGSRRPKQLLNENHEREGINIHDPRWRTISGQEELQNEFISPVTMSKQNSIRATVLRKSVDVDIDALQHKLKNAALGEAERPSSSSSDRHVNYGNNNAENPNNEPLPDLTSQSLPDDLSMGTQEFISHGGFINSRRGGRSNEASFLRKSLSQEPSPMDLNSRATLQLHSSPPQYSRMLDDSIEQSKLSASAPVTPEDTSVVHHIGSQLGPASSGSPLKLFGNRDTYTSNKLMRILNHFEEAGTSQDKAEDEVLTEEQRDNAFRMSQFGHGELDEFGFDQDIPRPSPIETAVIASADRIFKPITTNDGGAQTSVDETKSILSVSRHVEKEGDPPKDVGLSEKDRTAKRQKTLLNDQGNAQGQGTEVQRNYLEVRGPPEGKKRKDARPGNDGTLADPEILASRNLLKPKSARRSSVNRITPANVLEASVQKIVPEQSEANLTEALATELASFAQGAVQVNNDSRKPSLATKDYMEEANKVMQFIRSRGKPISVLPDIGEPGNLSDLNPDAILDLDIDADSTKDDFSRPPSRNRTSVPAADRRHARHDSRTASYLRKYQDEDGIEALANTSVFGTLAPTGNNLAVTPAQIPVSSDLQESSPPNMRIRNPTETMRKRKHSASTIEGAQAFTQDQTSQTQYSSRNSTQHTFPTNSSRSGHKGVIASGTVSIPDHVGMMTFDHERKTWIKKAHGTNGTKPPERRDRQTLTEDDPFEDIPDLSIDEQRELESETRRTQPLTVKPTRIDTVDEETKARSQASRKPLAELEPQVVKERDQFLLETEDDEEIDRSSLRSKASEHESRLHDGVPSQPPASLKDDRKQARVVTIAFSSPVVSAVNYANISEDDLDDLPREEDLPLDDSELEISDTGVNRGTKQIFAAEKVMHSPKERSQKTSRDHEPAVTFKSQTMSPIEEHIEEHDEEPPAGQMSLVHVNQSNELTPAPPRIMVKHQKSANKASSILCLTPLSEFSVHQVDSAKHPDQSYVEERKHPNALRQAHGSLALAVDELVKAITDAVPEELYWEQLHRMTIGAGSISSVHGLKDYCPALEELSAFDNKIAQLGGLPSSLRVLDIHNNMLNDLTSWGHLSNLQYLDVSGNQLESLEGFRSLIHLRSLKANNNRITNIDGILDLNGLLELQLGENYLGTVDFEGSELSRLRELNLSHNQLEEVRNLHSLPALEALDLSHNKLGKFEVEDMNKTLALKELRLSHNKLEGIGLKRMPMIKYLDMDNNNIKDIQGLSLAYHLEDLSLRQQSESSPVMDLVLSTPNECRRICLSSNTSLNGTFKLPTLPQNNLRELEIAACGISELPEGFGVLFPNCRILNANFNAIKDVTPVRKMLKLRNLLLAKNRIKKLRRTCLVLSRLVSLEKVDLRDNPLTIGFYSSVPSKITNDQSLPEARYHLPDGSQVEDATWMKVLDEVTGLRRRTIELLLAEHCKKLVHLDGLVLCHERLNAKDETWNKLTEQGVLIKPSSPSERSLERPAHENEGTYDAEDHQKVSRDADGDVNA
ncbi:uncharacterized protein Z518_03027 [Rhinocladiella mackenziei CBS 650.93]|uniref:Septation initiation network scaffold protein cdc11 n=1 Tax=Rhinocladiella mackenziei CBS 650.93 TaxID=1442369 RepID=A0A0D2IY96_9EURO|nr:uncharacterized protein Z518_03027 [Rhinocladiella mackenziei CBS 650.93]KIX08371.1 hypothetical protein Z518_03027 [Rhinocladiella mackenziei CBS 650.93]